MSNSTPKPKSFALALQALEKPPILTLALCVWAYRELYRALNKEVVKKAIQLGTAIEANINQYSLFARKNYFYPDLPKAYQISQFEVPIVSDGKLEIDTKEGAKIVRIERAHMEEDAGKNIHEGSCSLVDLNRACTLY